MQPAPEDVVILEVDEHGLEPDLAEELNRGRLGRFDEHALFVEASMIDHARGDFDQARRRFERALRIREETLGPEHSDVATSPHNLASH